MRGTFLLLHVGEHFLLTSISKMDSWMLLDGGLGHEGHRLGLSPSPSSYRLGFHCYFEFLIKKIECIQ
jgi:hypothetical protein